MAAGSAETENHLVVEVEELLVDSGFVDIR